MKTPIIEIMAIETSGLDPKKDIILEVAVLRLHKGEISGKAMPIDPGDFEFENEIIAYHTRTGLFDDMVKEQSTLEEMAKLPGPSNLRVLWARDFAAPFLVGTPLSAFATASDGKTILQLGRALGLAPDYDVMRAGDKVLVLAEVLKGLGA